MRNGSALPELDNRSRSAWPAMTRTALSQLIAWVLALTAQSLTSAQALLKLLSQTLPKRIVYGCVH
ncbi:hypothetical protein [Streptomyces sp. enrichment culture]|uniref:hypothetical protein n=1 Tax=Streptomyces sp. enrichment culture TaxID=1795815 RepID=UPI003F575097